MRQRLDWGSKCTPSPEERSKGALSLRPGVILAADGEGLTIFGGGKVYRLRNVSSEHVSFLEALRTGRAHVDGDASPGVRRLHQFLADKALIRPAFDNPYRGTRFERQVDMLSEWLPDPVRAQRALCEANVCIVGCGGTGTVAIQHLVGAGVGRYVCIDPDRVADTNFNRQFFPSWADRGRPKVDIAREYIQSRLPDASVNAHAKAVHSAADLEDLLRPHRPMVVVCCADTPPLAIQMAVVEYCARNDVPCTFGAVRVDDGTYGPFLTNAVSRERYRAHLRSLHDKRGHLDVPAPSPSFGCTNTYVALLMVQDVILFLAGFEDFASMNKRVLVDVLRHEQRVVEMW